MASVHGPANRFGAAVANILSWIFFGMIYWFIAWLFITLTFGLTTWDSPMDTHNRMNPQDEVDYRIAWALQHWVWLLAAVITVPIARKKLWDFWCRVAQEARDNPGVPSPPLTRPARDPQLERMISAAPRILNGLTTALPLDDSQHFPADPSTLGAGLELSFIPGGKWKIHYWEFTEEDSSKPTADLELWSNPEGKIEYRFNGTLSTGSATPFERLLRAIVHQHSTTTP